MRRLFPAFAAASLLAAASCGPQRIAGGGSSESGNAIVAGRVVDSGGAALAGARLVLVEEEDWLSKALSGRPLAVDSARADAQGRFELRVRRDRRLNLQVDGQDQGSFLRSFNASLDSGLNELTVVASPYGQASGVLTVAEGAATAIRLAGTDYRAELLPGGRFRFPGLPMGRYLSMVQLAWETDSTATPATTLRILPGVETQALMAAAADRFVLEDFAEPWPRARLTALTGRGNWYVVDDNLPPASQRSRIERALVEGGGSLDGPSLRARIVLDSAYAGMGLHLGLRASTCDFSSLRALVFSARGKGKVRVTVESPLLDDPLDEQFEYRVDLPEAWSTVRIPVDSLRLPPGSAPALRGVTWNQVASRIIRLEFMVKREFTAPGDTTEIWLDDIVLEGVPFRVFAP